jgi:hypothetical protein
MRYWMMALITVTMLGGCGGDDDGAEAKCERLVNTFCKAATECAEDADLLDPDYSAKELLADCKETVGEGAHCDEALDVSSRYDRCLNAAGEGLSCRESNQSLLLEDTFAIPDVCEGVVQYD